MLLANCMKVDSRGLVRWIGGFLICCLFLATLLTTKPCAAEQKFLSVKHKDDKNKTHEHHDYKESIQFTIRSVKDGKWSDPKTWKPPRVPKKHDRVLVSR